MAWAMEDLTSFGQAFPDGDLDAWEREIDHYFAEELSAQDREKYDNRAVLFCYAITRKFTEDLGFLAPYEQPKVFKTARKLKNLASLFMVQDKLLIVDQAMKETLEKLEPSVHQFWPMRITGPRDVEYPGQYFGMIVGRHIDSFDAEKSDPDVLMQSGDLPWFKSNRAENFNRIALCEAKIAGSHLWRESRIGGLSLCMSDTLNSIIMERGFSTPKFHRVRPA